MKDTFSRLHPIVNLLYFIAVLGLSMFLRQPVCLILALCSGAAYAGYLCGGKTLMRSLKILLPVCLLTIAVNPLVNHQGLTILGYFPNGNPFTLESLLYGLLAALILAAVVVWCICFQQVMTTEKLVYLFGKLLPALGLVVALSLRFIPRYRRQYQAVAAAQKQLGNSMERGKFFPRFRTALRILSIMLTWAMEHGLETAASMKSRGYGLPGRTAFSLYRWRKWDTVTMVFLLLTFGSVLWGILRGWLYFTCFPTFAAAPFHPGVLVIYIAYGGLFLFPLLLNGAEAQRFRRGRLGDSMADTAAGVKQF